MTAPAPHHAEYMRRMRDGMRQKWENNSGLPALARKYPKNIGISGARRIICVMGTNRPALLSGIVGPVLPADRPARPCTQ